jgi:hypothetical protein
MKRLSFALAILAASFAAAAAENRGAEPMAVATTLQPKGIHEECARMEAGQSRRWHWKSDAPVDFNIHYHRGNEVFFPVQRDGMRGDGGTFTAKTGEDYCWMWTARDAPTKLEGRIEK